MAAARTFLSRRRVLACAGILALLFGALMLHPYPRQSLFGPTIRGKPRCYWEGQIRPFIAHEPTWVETALDWLRIERTTLTPQEIFDDADMLPLVIEMVNDRDHQVRRVAMIQIMMHASLQDKSVLPALYERLEDGDLDTQIAAGRAIWAVNRDKKVLPIYLNLLDHSISGIRAHGMSHLAELAADAPELYPQLAARANDSNPRVRAPLMHAMQHFGAKGVPLLRAGLKDSDPEVRSAAALALGCMKPAPKDAIPALEACLTDADPMVRSMAAESLRVMDPERFKHLKGTIK